MSGGLGPFQAQWPDRVVCDMPWPVACKHCSLVTEDPEAFFYPVDWDEDMIPEHRLCSSSPDNVHEPMEFGDYAERALKISRVMYHLAKGMIA